MNRLHLTPRLDVHTHTVMSGHAYSTLQEMAKEASYRRLDILGITEHAPELPGACDPIYFRNLHVVPREMYGVRLLLGVELNILNYHGDISLNEDYYSRLDLRIAGIHSLCWEGGTREENTDGMLKVLQNPWVQIISHPGDGTAEVDFEPLVLAAGETKTLLEINNSSLLPMRKKKSARANNLEILRLCRRHGVPVILGSDAHISFSIADYGYLWELLEETDFPAELVMNDKPDEFLAYIG